MIYSMVLNLEPAHDAEISANQGRHALALFLSLIERVDGPLADTLHSDDGQKPFTISSLQGKFSRRKTSIFVRSKSPCWLRFTILEEKVFAKLMHSLLKGKTNVHLGDADFCVADVITHPQGSQWAGFDSFHGMLERASEERKILLQFTSPTVFRSAGKRNIAFPSPELVFGSLLSKWNAFSENRLDTTLVKTFGNGVLVSRYKLETKMLGFEDYQELGFVGKCEYIISSNVSQETLRTLNALADFAFFAGAGAKTTMGMGQTRRMRNVSTISGRAGSYAAKAS